MENMVWLDKLGIYDEELLKVNPKLVIVHISGLGNAKFGGVPSVCNRASYDMIGQAFSGWLYLQGFKDRDPVVAKPYMNDFVSAFAALFGTLAAYTVRAEDRQGPGGGHRPVRGHGPVHVRHLHQLHHGRPGHASAAATPRPPSSPTTSSRPRTARLVALGAFGPGVYKRCIQALGFDLGVLQLQGLLLRRGGRGQPQGPRAERQGGRVVRQPRPPRRSRASWRRPACPAPRSTPPRTRWRASTSSSRGDWVTYEDQTVGAPITAFGIAPKLSETPGRVWRGAPYMGQDTESRAQDHPRL